LKLLSLPVVLPLGYKRQYTGKETRKLLDDSGFTFLPGRLGNLQSFCRTEQLPLLLREIIYGLFLRRGFQFCWPHVMRFLYPRHGTTTSEAVTVPGLHLISMGRIRGTRWLDNRYVSIGVSKPGVCAHKVEEVSDDDSDEHVADYRQG
jgi:hypothetical protein